jgi:hypothetical protein
MAITREEKKKMAKSTKDSPGSIGSEGEASFLTDLPPISYTTIRVKDLVLPQGLLDEKMRAYSPAPIDPLLPILAAQSDKDGPVVIVDGCKRFKLLLERGRETCACGIFNGFLDEKRIGLLRIFLNQKRRMSARESVRFYRWLTRNCQGNDFEAILTLVGFHPALRSELELLMKCPDNCLDAVDEGRIAVRAAADLCLFTTEDQTAFLDSFRGIGLSLQTQREFLEWLPEIAYEKKTTVSSLLGSAKLQEIINDTILNNPQKIEAMRTLLHSWKFPLYDEALKNWKKAAAATSKSVLENEPSSKVVFMPGPAFEMNKLDIRITLNHAPAAKEIFRKLSEIPQSTWSQLIYPG